MYGWGENECRTEEISNLLVRQGRRARGKVVLATKVHGNMAADAESWPNHDKLSAVNIRRAVTRRSGGSRPTAWTSTSASVGSPRATAEIIPPHDPLSVHALARCRRWGSG